MVLPDHAAWNGKFLFLGNGGFAGSIQYSPVGALSLGNYAVAATDAGHTGNEFDASWALNNPAAQQDYSFRGVHVTAVATQSLVKSYYGMGASHRYFTGCSDGGHEAIVEVQRYPTDFDGVIAGDPAIGNFIAGFNWNTQAVLADLPHTWIPPGKFLLINGSIVANCDKLDGVLDNLIQDPRRCTFDPSSLQCAASDPDPDNDTLCLSRGQVQTLKAVYAGAETSGGTQIYPGYTKSNITNEWNVWIIGNTAPFAPPPFPWGSSAAQLDAAPKDWLFMDQFVKYFVFNDPGFNSLSFEINNTAQLDQEQEVNMRVGFDASIADLRPFMSSGGKLIMYHGWSDAEISPLQTIQYYDSVVTASGGDSATVRNFARLFMVPGMQHCSGGFGPSVFGGIGQPQPQQLDAQHDVLFALDRWVTHGIAPDGIIASDNGSGNPSPDNRTMPLCAYPEEARYTGGHVNDAANWDCR